MRLRLLIAIVLAGLSMWACDSSETARIQETRAKLVGNWSREVETEQIKGRRVLTLEQDGKFSERVVLVAEQGNSVREELGGEWLFDGTNFKRKYTHVNGRHLGGGQIRFATYELKSITESDFVGVDHIEGREIRYQRVKAGTQP